MSQHPAIKNITFTPALVYDHELEWPNGEGLTTCTKEYYDLHHEAKAIHDPSEGNMNDLSSEDYERYNEIADKIANLMVQGHIGRSYRF